MTLLNSSSRKWFDDRLEAFVDGSLPPDEAARFQQVAMLDDELKTDIHLSRQIHSALQATPQEVCPPHVARNIMAHVRRDIRVTRWQRVQAFFLSLSPAQLKPVMVAAVLLLVAITTVQVTKEAAEPQAQVNQALDDVKWTLAYLSGVGKATGSTVKSSVIENQIVHPMSRSFSTILEN